MKKEEGKKAKTILRMLSKQNLITTMQLQKKIDAKIKAIQEKSLPTNLFKKLYNKLATEHGGSDLSCLKKKQISAWRRMEEARAIQQQFDDDNDTRFLRLYKDNVRAGEDAAIAQKLQYELFADEIPYGDDFTGGEDTRFLQAYQNEWNATEDAAFARLLQKGVSL